MRFVRQFPDDPNAPDAVRRIELLDYRDAVATNTPYAYRQFLSRHPGSVFTIEVKHRLEDVEFGIARRSGGVAELEAFLDHWSGGRYASRTAALINEKKCKKWLRSSDPEAISKFRKLHPDAPCANELQALAEKLRFARAKDSGGVRELLQFIDLYPAGRFTQTARRSVITREVRAFLQAARFKRARRLLAGLKQGPARKSLSEEIDQARLDWISTSFDPKIMRAESDGLPPERVAQAGGRAKMVSTRSTIFAPLADATRKLRSATNSAATPEKRGPLRNADCAAQGRYLMPLTPQPVLDSIVKMVPPQVPSFALMDEQPPDPRDRWHLMEKLALLPDERCADFLLNAVSDSFIEVRREALSSLRKVIESLGRIRSERWLYAKTAALQDKAQSGVLVQKLAVLRALSGDRRRALALVLKEGRSDGNEDIFLDYLAASLSAKLEDPKLAATMAKTFSKAATRFCNQRIDAWREDGLGASQQGWLSLRQLFGATRLWAEVLEPFAEGEGGQSGMSSFESFLGNWLERSRATLEKTRAFLDQAEQEWAKSHSEYRPSATPFEKPAQQANRSEMEALARLAFSGRTSALVTISWAACCHPRRAIRALASGAEIQANLIRRLAVLWQVLDF